MSASGSFPPPGVPYGTGDIANFGTNAYWSGISLSAAQTSFYQIQFGFISQGIMLVNRGSAPVEYSFDGTNKHGELLATGNVEANLKFDKRHQNQIFLRSISTLSGTNVVRVEAW